MLGTTGILLRAHARTSGARSLMRSLAAGRGTRTSPLARQSALRVAPLTARNFSLWPFSSKAPAAPAPTEAESVAEAVTAEPVPVPDAAVAQATPADTIPDLVPSAPEGLPDALTGAVSTLTDAAHAVAAAGPSPLHWGDLTALGLTGWGPVGLSVWMLEAINVATGMSWFSTIVVGTAISRVICMPINIKQQQNTSRLAAYQPQLMKIKDELQATQQSQDMVAMQRVILKQQAIYREAGVSLPQMLLLPFAQLPVSLGMFFAVRRLVDAPLEQLHFSGIGHLIPAYADLTVADPYYALPLATAVFMNGFLWLMAKDMLATTERRNVGAILALFRTMSVLSIPFVGQWSIAMNLHVFTGILTFGAQSLMLRIPAVRAKLGIAPLPKIQQAVPGYIEGYKLAAEWWNNRSAAASQSSGTLGRSKRKW